MLRTRRQLTGRYAIAREACYKIDTVKAAFARRLSGRSDLALRPHCCDRRFHPGTTVRCTPFARAAREPDLESKQGKQIWTQRVPNNSCAFAGLSVPFLRCTLVVCFHCLTHG